MTPLSDGRYEVFVIDAAIIDANGMRIEVVVVAGDEKGAVIALRGPHLARDPSALLGLPATLVIEDGVPRVAFESH